MEKFKSSFGDVDNMSPLGYFNSSGTNMAKKVRLILRPVDLSYMVVETKIKLAILHEVFDVDNVFSHQYYLHLPQTCKSIPTPTSGSADNASGSGNDATDTLLQLAGGGSVATPSCTSPRESTTTADTS